MASLSCSATLGGETSCLRLGVEVSTAASNEEDDHVLQRFVGF